MDVPLNCIKFDITCTLLMKLPSLQLETLKVYPIQYRAGFCYKNGVAKVHLIVNENDLAILMFVHRY